MNRNLIYAGMSVVLAGLLGFSWAKGGGALSADDAKPNANEIAVVDMSKVFAGHRGLMAKNEEFKRDAERAQESIRTMAETAKQLQDELKMHKPGSAEHARIQKELQGKAADYKKFQEEMQRKLAEEQAANYLSTYQIVVEEIQRIAEMRGLKLVVNFSSEVIDQTDPKKAVQFMSRQVLYQNGLDITDDVLQAVN